MNVKSLTEAQLVQHLDAFARQLGLTVIGTEVKIGAYRLDAVAHDPSGSLVVIELKANASVTALSQLLLYPHALQKALSKVGVEPPPIRSILITTHLDRCLVEVARDLAASRHIEAWVAISPAPGSIALAAPESAGDQAWDQSEQGTQCLESVLSFLGAGPNSSSKPTPLRGAA